MGFLAGVASLVVVARFNQAMTTAGTGYEMEAIASCFIGGASAYGGVGRVGGAVIGAIFIGVLNMGMSLLGVDVNWQRVVKGMVFAGGRTLRCRVKKDEAGCVIFADRVTFLGKRGMCCVEKKNRAIVRMFERIPLVRSVYCVDVGAVRMQVRSVGVCRKRCDGNIWD